MNIQKFHIEIILETKGDFMIDINEMTTNNERIAAMNLYHVHPELNSKAEALSLIQEKAPECDPEDFFQWVVGRDMVNGYLPVYTERERHAVSQLGFTAQLTKCQGIFTDLFESPFKINKLPHSLEVK